MVLAKFPCCIAMLIHCFRDILAQLDDDIEEQEMDKRSRIELLSYLNAALKNKNIELDLELKHLAKEEETLNDKEQVEDASSNEAALKANINQLNRRIKDLDERTLRLSKMKQQQLLEKIPEDKEALDFLSRQKYASTNTNAKKPSGQGTIAPFQFTKNMIKLDPLLREDKAPLLKPAASPNFGYVPYPMPISHYDPLQILRLTNPDFAALAQPGPWLPSSWAEYSPNLLPYQVSRQISPPFYAALARHQALPVPMRKS